MLEAASQARVAAKLGQSDAPVPGEAGGEVSDDLQLEAVPRPRVQEDVVTSVHTAQHRHTRVPGPKVESVSKVVNDSLFALSSDCVHQCQSLYAPSYLERVCGAPAT